MGWRIVMAAPYHSHPRTLHQSVRPHHLALASDPHIQCLRVHDPRSRTDTGDHAPLISYCSVIHIRAATCGISSKCHQNTAAAQIRSCKTGQRERCRGLSGGTRVQRQTREASSTLSIDPGYTEVLRCKTPDGRVVAGMEIVDRAPDIRRGSAVIDKECISPSAASQEVKVRSGPTVQDILPPCTAIASSPLPEWMNQLSLLTPIFRLWLVIPIYSCCKPLTGPV